jgi:hypothetical protein
MDFPRVSCGWPSAVVLDLARYRTYLTGRGTLTAPRPDAPGRREEISRAETETPPERNMVAWRRWYSRGRVLKSRPHRKPEFHKSQADLGCHSRLPPRREK